MADYADDGSGHQNDLGRYRTPGQHASANRTWGYSTDKDYMVDTDQLKSLAATIEQDLHELKSGLQKVTSAASITTQHVGWSDAGKEFVQLAEHAKTGFSQYYKELLDGYRTVIGNLYSSAGDHKKAEEYTTSAVMSVDVGSTSPGQGPTTDSTGRFDSPS